MAGAFLLFVATAACGDSEERGGAPDADPIFTENHPGELVVTSPARAAFLPAADGAQVLVTGTGASPELEINGQPVTPADDGSFASMITATDGLNLIRLVDGDQALDTPFLYGRFEPADAAVAGAVAVRVNAAGYNGFEPTDLSLTLLAQTAVDGIDLLAPLEGTTHSGSIPGGSWTYVVKGTSYGKTHVLLTPRSGGAKFDFAVEDVRVDGTLTVKVLLSKTDDASLSADRVNVTGLVDGGLDGGAVSASGNSVESSMEGFQYDSNNAGFPCCVDGIVTDYLRPKVRDMVQAEVKKILEKEVAFALNQLALPDTIELDGLGLAPIAVSQHFDGAAFEADGTTLSAAVRFQASDTASGPEAPGWLAVGGPPAASPLEPPFGMMVSLDALNQALFATWAVNGMARTLEEVPLAGTVEMVHALPPVVLANDHGGVTAQAGEIVIDANVSGAPVKAAISIVDDIQLSLDPKGQSLVLTPSPEPQISLTWLAAEDLSDSLREIIKTTILEELPAMLTPISIPLPSLPLGGIAESFGTSVGALGPDTAVAVDSQAQRLSLWGSLVVMQDQ
jgi:hypothetical protein